MNLFVDTLKNHNDSIFSPSEITPELTKSLVIFDPVLQVEYMNLDKRYHEEGVAYNRQYLLSQITNQISNTLSWDYYKAYQLVNEISNLLHLNQFELAHWSILLDCNSQEYFRPVLSSYFTAYQVKCNMNRDTRQYEHQLNIKIPNFRYLYYNWQLIFDTTTEPTLKEINKRYAEMMQNRKIRISYNKLVDELVEIPRRKETNKECTNDFISKLDGMNQELEDFQSSLLEGEKLSPIGGL